MRTVLFNEQDEKRRRNQMLTQSFADIIQISPQSSVITKVFLPKKPLVALFKEPVEVEQVRDVHLYLEVVSEMVEEVIAKGQLRLGLTMDQVSTALGFPDSISKSNDQTVWRYSTGKFDSLVFNSEAKLFQWTERKVKDQILQMINSAKTDDIQKLLGLIYAPSPIDLKDGSFVWLKPGNVDFDLVFSKSGILERVNDKPPIEFITSLEGNIRMTETERLLGRSAPESRADRLGGRIWIFAKEKVNMLFDRDFLLVDARYALTDMTLDEQNKSADASYTRKLFENELGAVAASLFGERKAALEEFKKELQRAGEDCKSTACTYPAPESPELEYRVQFSSDKADARFMSIQRQPRAAPVEAPKPPAAKPAKP